MWSSFENKNIKDLKLGVYSIFGDIAFKAWACRPNNEKDDVPDQMISVLKDGKRISSYAQKPTITFQYTDGVESEVDIISMNKSVKILVDRKILRPGYSLKRPPGLPPPSRPQ